MQQLPPKIRTAVQQQMGGQPRENGLTAAINRSRQNCITNRSEQTEWGRCALTSFLRVIVNWEHWKVSMWE